MPQPPVPQPAIPSSGETRRYLRSTTAEQLLSCPDANWIFIKMKIYRSYSLHIFEMCSVDFYLLLKRYANFKNLHWIERIYTIELEQESSRIA